ncbi:putative glycosyl transferase [Paratrimastix pyriformis]|uniref:Glycosyl transferase n=1 Tax=Paratrimastix pyriformis TaxID=342808 RepID=A0ABQ8UQD6_9EUKA|nr:putative glycosyl transferase [Paratrimastix pyriformis]
MRCGVGAFSQKLVESLQRNGALVHVYAYHRAGQAPDNAWPSEVVHSFDDHDSWNFQVAGDMIEQGHYDMVLVHHEFSLSRGKGFDLAKLLEHARTPFKVLLVHSPFAYLIRKGEVDVLYLLARSSDRVVVLSPPATSTLRHVVGMPSAMVRYIPHGVPDDFGPLRGPDATQQRAALKERLGLLSNSTGGPPRDRPVLLTFGIFHENKGLEYMVAAMPEVLRRHPDALYLIQGSYDRTDPDRVRYMEGIAKFVRDHGIEQHVLFRHQYATEGDLLAYLQACDLFVTPYIEHTEVPVPCPPGHSGSIALLSAHPSLQVSGTLTFAMAAGAPVLSTDFRYAKAMLSDGLGLIVPQRNSQALAKGALQLLDHPTETRAMGHLASERLRSFRWTPLGRGYLDLLMGFSAPLPEPLQIEQDAWLEAAPQGLLVMRGFDGEMVDLGAGRRASRTWAACLITQPDLELVAQFRGGRLTTLTAFLPGGAFASLASGRCVAGCGSGGGAVAEDDDLLNNSTATVTKRLDHDSTGPPKATITTTRQGRYRLVTETVILAGDLALTGRQTVTARYPDLVPEGILGRTLWRQRSERGPVEAGRERQLFIGRKARCPAAFSRLQQSPIVARSRAFTRPGSVPVAAATITPSAAPASTPATTGTGGRAVPFGPRVLSVAHLGPFSGAGPAASLNRALGAQFLRHPESFRWSGFHERPESASSSSSTESSLPGEAHPTDGWVLGHVSSGPPPDPRALATDYDVLLCDGLPSDWHRLPPAAALDGGHRPLTVYLSDGWRFQGAGGVPPAAWADLLNREADLVLAPSRFLAAVLRASGVHPDRITQMPFGVDPTRARPDGDRASLPTRKSFVVLTFAGRDAPDAARLGVDVLVRAYRRAFTGADDVALVLVEPPRGSAVGGLDGGFPTALARPGPSDSERASPLAAAPPEIHVLQVPLAEAEVRYELLRSTRLFVDLTRSEDFSTGVVEALACGTPVLTTTNGRAAEFLTAEASSFVNSTWVPCRAGCLSVEAASPQWLEPNEDHLAELLLKAYQHPEAELLKARRGREQVLAHFSWDVAVQPLFDRISEHWVACLADAARCIYSMQFYEEIDWHCYHSFGRILLSGDLNYEHYICDYGRMYYPAAFAYAYGFFEWLTGGSAHLMQYIHCAVHVLCTYLTLTIFLPLVRRNPRKQLGLFVLHLACILALEQNTYRSAIARITNDTLQLPLVLIMLRSILAGRWWVSSVCYALAVAFKMNALYYGPSLLVVYLTALPFWTVFWHFFVMGCIEVLLPAPFLLANLPGYLKVAFNFGRDFDNTTNLAWAFLGDHLRQRAFFYKGLLACTVLGFAAFFALVVPSLIRWGRACPHPQRPVAGITMGGRDEHTEAAREDAVATTQWLRVVTMLLPNLIGYTFSRGVHVQFELWIMYAMPFLLLVAAELPLWLAGPLMFLFDTAHLSHRYAKRVLDLETPFRPGGSLLGDLIADLTPLDTLEKLEAHQATGKPLYWLAGSYFPRGWSLRVVPFSWILWAIEVLVLSRVFWCLARWVRNHPATPAKLP